MNFTSPLIVALLALAAGCSGSNSGSDLTRASSSSSSGASGTATSTGTSPDAAALFDTPSGTPTPGTIFGLWGGVENQTDTSIDVRVRITTTTISNALRCTLTKTQHRSGIVGVTAAARNTEDDLVFLESKNDSFDDGTIRCSTSVAPKQLERCASDVQSGFEENCFSLDGTKLTLFGDPLQNVELVKLSD